MSSTLMRGRVRWPAERRFYTGMALAMFATIHLGFAPSFFLRPWFPATHAAPEPFFYFHGAVFAGWFVLLIASIALLVAAIARWPYNFKAHGPLVFFAVSDLFLLALVAWDYASRKKIHPVTLWAGLFLVASQPLRLMLSGTEAWLSFAGWAVGLLGP